MKATRNCIIAIGATQEAQQQANSIIDAMYEGYVSHPVVVQPFVMPHVRHVHLGPYIGVNLRGKTTHI